MILAINAILDLLIRLIGIYSNLPDTDAEAAKELTALMPRLQAAKDRVAKVEFR